MSKSALANIFDLVMYANHIRQFSEDADVTYEEAIQDLTEMPMSDFIEKYEGLALDV